MATVNTPSPTLHLIHLPQTSKSATPKCLFFTNKKNPESKIRISASRTSNVILDTGFGSSKGGGAGVLERPDLDLSQFGEPHTQVQEGGDIGRSRDNKRTGSGDSYRVLLIDDIRHTETLVAKALPEAVPSVTPDDARRLFHLSRDMGLAVVLVTVKEHAEFYSQMMVRKGLRSTIEPDSATV